MHPEDKIPSPADGFCLVKARDRDVVTTHIRLTAHGQIRTSERSASIWEGGC